ncbi:MAG TPA: serine/threonine-protein kinase [Archangium sp.]|nr:serine/threonine-protein kinase [Archangium sp.]
MSEATAEPQEGRGLPFAWRRLLWRRAACKEEVEAKQLPPLRTLVGGYLLEARRGQGGFGTVYRARSEERLYAVKFIPLRHARTWGTREMEVLLRLKPQGIASLEGHGYWPVHAPRFLYIVTRYVAGRTVSAWARERNPTARQVARLLLELARVLVAVHRAGVVHADVKGANVLVRDEDGEVILVDFGAATYEGAPPLTTQLPPGTPHYRSPEALRFRRQHRRGESYHSTPGDDLWALGVLLCWLLTGTWPFDVTEPDAALHQEPVPPHERNPRVPEALDAVCLRLLAKTPEARYAEARAVVAALEEALAGADARWDVPLCDAYGPDTATTPVEVELDTEEATARLERLAAYREQHPPARGRPVPPEEASTLVPVTVTAPPTEEAREAVRPRPRWGVWLGLAVGLVLGLLAAR